MISLYPDKTLAAQEVPGTAEANPGSGAGFKKHVAKNCSLKDARDTLPTGVRQHLISSAENLVNIRALKLSDRENMRANKIHD